MGDLESQGLEYEQKAEKKLKGWGMFTNKYDDAAELLEKAGNSYKLAKACKHPFPYGSFSSALLLTLAPNVFCPCALASSRGFRSVLGVVFQFRSACISP